MRLFVSVASSFLVCGCIGNPDGAGVGGTTGGGTTGQQTADGVAHGTTGGGTGIDLGTVDVPFTDIGTPDMAPDLPQEETDVVEPGALGWPCVQNSDCLSDWCVPTPSGKQCSKLCIDSCPDGWGCKSVPTWAPTMR